MPCCHGTAADDVEIQCNLGFPAYVVVLKNTSLCNAEALPQV
jgi:hypothetical protein